MPITEFLERNAKFYPDDVALVEVNPENQPEKTVTWKEYSLIETAIGGKYRREMTWKEFDTKANRFANLLMTREVKKGDKVLISKYSGTNVKLDGEEYIIVRMEDILAVVD